jgi:hypothetical protein
VDLHLYACWRLPGHGCLEYCWQFQFHISQPIQTVQNSDRNGDENQWCFSHHRDLADSAGELVESEFYRKQAGPKVRPIFLSQCTV